MASARDPGRMHVASARDGRALLGDAVLLVAVAGALAGTHWLLPPGIRGGLALDYASPDPLHAFTAAYVHLTQDHLRGNVAGFLLAGALASLLADLADARWWFRLSSLTYLTVLPVAVGMTAATVVDGGVVARGFSSVVAAYVGFILVSPGVLLRRSFGAPGWVGWNVVAGLCMVVATVILRTLGGDPDPRATAALVVGLLLVAGGFVRPALDRRAWPADRNGWVDLLGAVTVIGVVLGVVTAMVVGLFPAEIVRADGVTNVLGHYLGLVYGAVIAAWGSRYWAPAGSESVNRGS